MGCLQQQHRALLSSQCQHCALSFACFGRQEADENKPAGFVGDQTGDRDQSGNAARTWQGNGSQVLRAHCGHQPRAGVADAGRAGIADIGHALALAQMVQHGLRGLRLIVLVHGDQLPGSLVDAVRAQQRLGVARVFTRDGVDQA